MKKEQLSWQEMKQRYPNQSLLIVDYQSDESGRLLSGVVTHHAADMRHLNPAPEAAKQVAYRYTGESTYPGLRHHVYRHAV